MPLDLVLVNPGGRRGVYQSLGKSLTAIEPPIWAGLMANFIRAKGGTAAIVDAEALDLSPEETAGAVDALDPLLAAVVVYGHQPSASTQNMTAAGEAARAIKALRPGLPLLLLGGHVSALPERTLREEAADFAAVGEGLHTLADLIAALKAGGADLDKVRGLLRREGEGFRQGPPAPLVMDLDRELPGVAWDLLPMERYRAHNWHCFGDLPRQPYAAIYTTLGCPYHCSFCCIQAPFKSGEKAAGVKEGVNSYRFWSPDFVAREIETLAGRYGAKSLKIADEMFVLNPRHVLSICDRILERGFDLNLWAYARVDTVRDGMSQRLRRAGFRWLAFGIEAASERVREDVQKGFGADLVQRTLERVRGEGIHVIGNYIFGLPEDDAKTMKETLDLALDLNCEFANFYCAMAYPGSPLYDLAQKNRWPLPKSWRGYSQHAVETLPLPTRHVPAADVLRFRDEAFQAYFRHPPYLDLVRRKFGEGTVRHLEEMASHRLDREILPRPF